MSQPLTILYDARCNLCLATVDFLRGVDFDVSPKFVDLNDPVVPRDYPLLDRENLLGQMWLVAPDGAASGGYDALVNLAATRPSMQPFIPLLRWGPVRGAGWRMYRWVARHRHQLFGTSECSQGACVTG